MNRRIWIMAILLPALLLTGCFGTAGEEAGIWKEGTAVRYAGVDYYLRDVKQQPVQLADGWIAIGTVNSYTPEQVRADLQTNNPNLVGTSLYIRAEEPDCIYLKLQENRYLPLYGDFDRDGDCPPAVMLAGQQYYTPTTFRYVYTPEDGYTGIGRIERVVPGSRMPRQDGEANSGKVGDWLMETDAYPGYLAAFDQNGWYAVYVLPETEKTECYPCVYYEGELYWAYSFGWEDATVGERYRQVGEIAALTAASELPEEHLHSNAERVGSPVFVQRGSPEMLTVRRPDGSCAVYATEAFCDIPEAWKCPQPVRNKNSEYPPGVMFAGVEYVVERSGRYFTADRSHYTQVGEVLIGLPATEWPKQEGAANHHPAGTKLFRSAEYPGYLFAENPDGTLAPYQPYQRDGYERSALLRYGGVNYRLDTYIRAEDWAREDLSRYEHAGVIAGVVPFDAQPNVNLEANAEEVGFPVYWCGDTPDCVYVLRADGSCAMYRPP